MIQIITYTTDVAHQEAWTPTDVIKGDEIHGIDTVVKADGTIQTRIV